MVGDDSFCYIGVYKLPSANTDTYYFGTPYFFEYYVSLSLDQWEADKSTNTFLNVGMGKLNPDICLGDIVYNKEYVDYNSAALADDISFAVPGVDIHYTNNTCKYPYDKNAIDKKKADEQATMNMAIIIASSVIGVIIITIVVALYLRHKKK
jgi:hypothetical protein